VSTSLSSWNGSEGIRRGLQVQSVRSNVNGGEKSDKGRLPTVGWVWLVVNLLHFVVNAPVVSRCILGGIMLEVVSMHICSAIQLVSCL
jgi:hypothetical protein